MQEKVNKPFYKKWWFIAIAIVFVFGAFGSKAEDKNKETASSTLAVETVEPESVKTEEPYVAISTPEPTVAPASQEDEQKYINEVNEIVDKYETAYQKFIDITSTAANDSSVIKDKEWREECVQAIVQVKKCNVLANDLIAPDYFEKLDANVKLAANHYESAMDLYAKGIDDFDSSSIDACGEELDKGNYYMSFVLEELER